MRGTPGVGGRWSSHGEEPAPLQRWLAFNLVGGLGILIQLTILAALTAGVGLHYLLATGLAVEAAVLHNFLWHERWTWRDRASQDKPGWGKRLLRFQIANGALSLGGNLVLMQVLVSTCAVNYTLANVASITLCSILNFLASDRLVFDRPRQLAPHPALQYRKFLFFSKQFERLVGAGLALPSFHTPDKRQGQGKPSPYETRSLRLRRTAPQPVPKRPATV